TQVDQAILERRPAPIIARLKEILAKPDPALGYLNGELRFWLAGRRKLPVTMLPPRKVGNKRAANWNLSSGNNRRIGFLLAISRWSIWVLEIKPPHSLSSR